MFERIQIPAVVCFFFMYSLPPRRCRADRLVPRREMGE